MTALLWLTLVMLQAAPDAQPANAVIRGRVTDKDSGTPIARAIVRIASRSSPSQQVVTLTDNDGRYELGGLAAGTYSGFVEAGRHRATHLMGWLGAESREQIVLKAGEALTDVNIALARSLAMTVRVVDEWGEPLAGVRISVTSADTGATPPRPFNRATDDRGRLRIYQLPPGRYLVCAQSSTLLTDAANAPRRERFLHTCYPSAASDAQAQTVRVDGHDLDEIVIQMRLGRTFRISGTVVDAAGTAAQNPFVSFTTFEANGSSSTSVALSADGSFAIANVPSGDYAIEATIGGPERPEQTQEPEAGFQPLVVDSSDVEGVVISMAKSVEVAGRFVFEETGPTLIKPQGSGLFLSARLAGDELRGRGSSVTAHTGEDRTFRFRRMFGKRTFDVANVPRGWYVKAIRYRGRDIIDEATELKAGTDPSALEVVLSNLGAAVTGRVTDDRGNPVRGARVFLLPANLARLSRFPDYVTTSATGSFRAGPQRPGDYVLVALGPSGSLPLNDRSRLTQLAQVGERITLGDAEERTLDLTVVRIDR
jgi:protocatechuate 3,4-dioxygenase beta subunit